MYLYSLLAQTQKSGKKRWDVHCLGYKSTLLLDIKVDTHKGNYYEGLAD